VMTQCSDYGKRAFSALCWWWANSQKQVCYLIKVLETKSMVSITVISIYFIYIILHINHIITKDPSSVLLIAVITGYEPQPDLQISPISWANIPCAIWASTCGEWIIGINPKQFQRSFIESRFLDLLKSKSHVRQCQHKSTKQIFCTSRKAH